MSRIERLNEIIDLHISCLEEKDQPMLSDTKTLTEILKAILVLEQIRSIEGKKSKYDTMSEDDLESSIHNIGGDE